MFLLSLQNIQNYLIVHQSARKSKGQLISSELWHSLGSQTGLKSKCLGKVAAVTLFKGV